MFPKMKSSKARNIILSCWLVTGVQSFLLIEQRKHFCCLKAQDSIRGSDQEIEGKKLNHSRRTFVSRMTSIELLSTLPLIHGQLVAHAEDAVSSISIEGGKNLSPSQIYNFLHVIPTFTIVDPTGVPYTVVGEDAKLTTYFFTSYNEASRILNSASRSSDRVIGDLEREENSKRKVNGEKSLSKKELIELVGENPWKEARISTVPLDFGVTLSNKGKIKGQYFRVAPSEVSALSS